MSGTALAAGAAQDTSDPLDATGKKITAAVPLSDNDDERSELNSERARRSGKMTSASLLES